MSYSSIIRESEDFGCVICDDAGTPAVRVGAVDAAAVRPDPRLHRAASTAASPSSARSGSRATSSSTTTRTTAPRTSPTSASSCPIFYEGELVGVLGHDRAPPRPRRADARQRAGSSTPPTPTPRGSSSTRSRSRRKAVATSGSGRSSATTSAPPSSSSATWRRRSPRAKIGAERFVELIERYGLETVRGASEDLMDYSERMLRREIEKLPDGTLRGRGPHRRLPRPSRPRLPQPRASRSR